MTDSECANRASVDVRPKHALVLVHGVRFAPSIERGPEAMLPGPTTARVCE